VTQLPRRFLPPGVRFLWSQHTYPYFDSSFGQESFFFFPPRSRTPNNCIGEFSFDRRGVSRLVQGLHRPNTTQTHTPTPPPNHTLLACKGDTHHFPSLEWDDTVQWSFLPLIFMRRFPSPDYPDCRLSKGRSNTPTPPLRA